jgi:hypothetical protein
MDRRRRLRLCAAALAAALSIAAGPPAPDDPAAIAGAWDLSREGTNRKCRLTFGPEPSGSGQALRFPAGCRRALPVLGGAAAWHVPERGVLRLIDAAGQPALEFHPEGDDAFTAKTAAGESYRLERDAEARLVRLPPPPPPIGVPQVTPIDPARAPPPASLPGTYAVDRYTERDVCRVRLAASLPDPHGRYEARLVEGCRDAGLRSFDPAAWRYDGGRLTLTSRRGHEVTLISEREDHWRRDPEVGATLVLRKVTP